MMRTRVLTALILAGLAQSAFATNGYFSHGYGMKAKGMAGAATAMTDNAFGAANNPATMAFAGNRLDLGADLFSPIREASRSGSGGIDGTSDSNNKYFLIPELGYNHMVSNDMALGLAVYGNGGMNTTYPGNVVPGANLLGGPGGLGVDLMQLIVAPSLAFKFTPDHSVGVAPLLGYQRFKANGLAAFGGASSDPAALTNNGYDYSYGYGIRVGYFGKLTPTVSVGAAYATKMNFGEFDKYAGLFAEQGDLDIPSNWTLGAAWQTTPELKLALDYQRINYSGVKSVGNAAANSLVGPNGLGTDGGSGFGWDDVNVWKLGAEYQYSPSLTLRGGLSHANQPIDGAAFGEVMFNILAPGVIKNHMTLGFTYTLASGDELSMAYMHGFKNDVSGADPFFGGTDTLRMYQNSLGAQYSWKF